MLTIGMGKWGGAWKLGLVKIKKSKFWDKKNIFVCVKKKNIFIYVIEFSLIFTPKKWDVKLEWANKSGMKINCY